MDTAPEGNSLGYQWISDERVRWVITYDQRVEPGYNAYRSVSYFERGLYINISTRAIDSGLVHGYYPRGYWPDSTGYDQSCRQVGTTALTDMSTTCLQLVYVQLQICHQRTKKRQSPTS